MRTPLMMCCLERGFMDDTLCQPRYPITCHYAVSYTHLTLPTIYSV